MRIFSTVPLPGTFGVRLQLNPGVELAKAVTELERNPEQLLQPFYDHGGLLVLSGVGEITQQPELMVRMSQLFGTEVENYRETLTPSNMIHATVPQILLLSNRPPCDRQPPPRPNPAFAEDGLLPVQFPHRRGWHTDQSFRRPPPDVSLFYGVLTPAPEEAQTLFADGVAAYEALSSEMQQRLEGLQGLHALLGTGRSEDAVRKGEPVKQLLPHQYSQRQPVVRVHPVTGKRALYLCEAAQMDWLDGPLVGMEPGPDGEGAALLYELMRHFTQRQFCHVHEWQPGEMVIYDNRCLIHAGTWYDVTRSDRLMWRTTVMGNPGADYDGEAKSWIPEDGLSPMAGLGNLQWNPREAGPKPE